MSELVDPHLGASGSDQFLCTRPRTARSYHSLLAGAIIDTRRRIQISRIRWTLNFSRQRVIPDANDDFIIAPHMLKAVVCFRISLIAVDPYPANAEV